jgi:hypothetical protein
VKRQVLRLLLGGQNCDECCAREDDPECDEIPQIPWTPTLEEGLRQKIRELQESLGMAEYRIEQQDRIMQQMRNREIALKAQLAALQPKKPALAVDRMEEDGS